MRAIRMAAVPLLALLVVGSIWTGMVIDRGESDSPGAGNSRSAGTPMTRGLVTPVERDLKRDIASAEAARGPAHPEVAGKLVELAALYRAQGRYADAIRTTRDLADLYRVQGRVNEANDLLRGAGQR